MYYLVNKDYLTYWHSLIPEKDYYYMFHFHLTPQFASILQPEMEDEELTNLDGLEGR